MNETFDRTIDSRRLLRMARKDAKDLRMYYFGNSSEKFSDISEIGEFLYWAFIGVEAAYNHGIINRDVRDDRERYFDNIAQKISIQVEPAQKQYDRLDRELISILHQHKKPPDAAIPVLTQMLDFERSRNFNGKYTDLYNTCMERDNPRPDD